MENSFVKNKKKRLLIGLHEGYIYGGSYRNETWEEYCKRKGFNVGNEAML